MVKEVHLNWSEPGRPLTHTVIARELRIEGDIAVAGSIRTRCGQKVSVIEPGTVNRAKVNCVPCLEADWVDDLTADLEVPPVPEPAASVPA